MNNSLHESLRKSFNWYRSWHDHPRHQHTHWMVFLVIILSAFSFVSDNIGNFYFEENFVGVRHARAAADDIDLSQVIVVNSDDVRSWASTATIANVSLNGQTFIDFDKRDGANRWPDQNCSWCTPTASDPNPTIQYTTWLFFNIGGQWYGSGVLENYYGKGAVGPITDGNCGWYYSNAWAPMHDFQLTAGTPIGFMVAAGDQRIAGRGINDVFERSNVVLIPSPYDLNPTTWTGCASQPPPPPPAPTLEPRYIYFLDSTSVQPGQPITIIGKNLSLFANFYNSSGAVVTTSGTINSDLTELKVNVPQSLTAGFYTVSVGPTPESNKLELEILVGAYNPGPQSSSITSLYPLTVSPGDELTISGENLADTVQFIDFNGYKTTVVGKVSASLETTTVIVPSNLFPGLYTVAVLTPKGVATSPDVLTVQSDNDDVSAASGPEAQANPPATKFQDLITGAFNYSLALVGIAVFLMIMWGGFLWLTSAANPGNISSAKKYITNALLGAVLLVSAYVILFTINPELVGGGLTLPGIEGPANSGGYPNDWGCSSNGDCASNYCDPSTFLCAPNPVTGGGQINACNSCSAYSGGVTAGGQPIQCVGNYVDSRNFNPSIPVNSTSRTCSFVEVQTGGNLLTLRQITTNWVMSEGFPPTVTHADACHGNGTCVDITLSPKPSATLQLAQDLDNLCAAVYQAGFSNIINEYSSLSGFPYNWQSCPFPKSTPFQTGDHLHIVK